MDEATRGQIHSKISCTDEIIKKSGLAKAAKRTQGSEICTRLFLG